MKRAEEKDFLKIGEIAQLVGLSVRQGCGRSILCGGAARFTGNGIRALFQHDREETTIGQVHARTLALLI